MPLIRTLEVGRPTEYYTSITTGTLYTQKVFGFDAANIIVSNDGSEDIQLSWDGILLGGEIKAGETITFAGKKTDDIWYKSASGGMSGRVWAY